MALPQPPFIHWKLQVKKILPPLLNSSSKRQPLHHLEISFRERQQVVLFKDIGGNMISVDELSNVSFGPYLLPIHRDPLAFTFPIFKTYISTALSTIVMRSIWTPCQVDYLAGKITDYARVISSSVSAKVGFSIKMEVEFIHAREVLYERQLIPWYQCLLNRLNIWMDCDDGSDEIKEEAQALWDDFDERLRVMWRIKEDDSYDDNEHGLFEFGLRAEEFDMKSKSKTQEDPEVQGSWERE